MLACREDETRDTKTGIDRRSEWETYRDSERKSGRDGEKDRGERREKEEEAADGKYGRD